MQGRVHDPGSTATELPPLDRAYEIDFRLLSDRLAEIPDDVNGILRLFDGRRTLAQVLAEADRQGLGAVEIVAKLWSEDVIRPALRSSPASAPPVLEADGAREATPAGDPEPPQEAEWFRSPAEAEPAPPAPATSSAAPHAEEPPRIVRFPAKRKEPPVATPAPVAPPRAVREPPPAARRRASPQQRAVRRRATADGARRRSAAALVVAAALAGVVIWRMVASRAPATEESGARAVTTGATPSSTATSTSAPPSTSSPASAGQPPQARDPAVERGERGQRSTTPPSSASSR